jgi:hypothetical protein
MKDSYPKVLKLFSRFIYKKSLLGQSSSARDKIPLLGVSYLDERLIASIGIVIAALAVPPASISRLKVSPPGVEGILLEPQVVEDAEKGELRGTSDRTRSREWVRSRRW